MKTIKIVCLLSVLLSFAMASEFVPALTHNSKAAGVFGYTDIGDAYEVDTGAGLVFQVRKTDGSFTSIVFNGTEYKSTTNRFSQIASGLGTPTTVTPETDGATYVKITLQTDPANGVVANLTHYLVVRNGENTKFLRTPSGHNLTMSNRAENGNATKNDPYDQSEQQSNQQRKLQY